MPIRVAVVGCGALARASHLPTIVASQAFELVVTCDSEAAAAADAARCFGARRAVTDWHEVVKADDVDLIVLCTHTNLRAELIVPALERGKPVYCEKPLAAAEEEMRTILAAARRTRVPVCVGHNRRSAPAILELRRLIGLARAQGADRPAIIDRNSGLRQPVREESALQLLLRVNDDARTWKGWIFDDPQGIMLSEMVHFIDVALWLAGSDPVEVYANGSPRGNFSQIIAFRDGSLATIQHSMVGNFDYPKELIEASARNVTIAMDHYLEVRQRGLEGEPFRTCYALEQGAELTSRTGLDAFHEAVDRLQELRRASRPLPCPWVFPAKGHRQQLERFAAHLRGEGENPCPVEGAIIVTRVALKMLQSARSGLPVRLLPEDFDLVQADFAAMRTCAKA